MAKENAIQDPSSIITIRENREGTKLAEAGKYYKLKKALLVIFAILVAGPVELLFLYIFGF